VRTFCIITTAANDLVSRIHDRMPAILRPEDYARWLGQEEPPADLLASLSADPTTMWPISTRVNSPKNDDAQLLEAIELDK
jgi:putative SOS response-associated peptidase YedK